MPVSISELRLFRPGYSFIIGLIFFCLPLFNASAQLYLLNEDFSSASGVAAPAAWSNYRQNAGSNAALWQFDNPTSLPLAFPISGKAASFDGAMMPSGSTTERISLESPLINCSISNNILLFFNQNFSPGQNGKGILEVFNGESWGVHSEFTTASSGTVQEILNLSALAGGKSNVKIRFSWEGDTTGFWALDNIKILVPSPRDLNLFSLDSPKMPFESGTLPVKVSLFNEGIETLNSATIQWNVNGVQQPSFNWTGSLPFGEKASGIEIGSFAFPPGGIRTFRLWVSNPNNNTDYNRFNDTISSRLGATMCGNYTIGGANPDFASFSEAAFALNNASISCPVVFKVRPGVYQEQVFLGRISGSSAQNTITFEPSNGDSTSVSLQYNVVNNSRDYTLALSGTQYIRFKKLNILRQNGQIAILINDHLSGLEITSCRLGNLLSLADVCDSNITISRNTIGYISLQGIGNSRGLIINRNNIRLNSVKGGVFSGINIRNFENPVVRGNGIQVNTRQDIAGTATDATGLQASGCPQLQVQGNSFQCSSSSYFGNRINQSLGMVIATSPNSIISQNTFSLSSKVGFAVSEGIISDQSSSGITIEKNDILLASSGTPGYGGTKINGIRLLASRGLIRQNTIRLADGSAQLMNRAIACMGDSSLISANTISNCLSGIAVGGDRNKVVKNSISSVKGTGIDLLEGMENEVLQNQLSNITEGLACRVSSSSSLIANNFFQVGGAGLSIGIKLDTNATNSRVYFNSVNATGTDAFNNSALLLNGSAGSIIQNNIFSCPGNGSAITVSNPGTALVWNHNCYYSPSDYLLSFNASAVYSLSGLISALGQNVGSISVNPFFSTETDLTSNHIAVNAAAFPVAGLNVDIRDSVRSATPDIGAREFNPCGFDAGVDRFIGLQSPIPSGTRPVKVLLHNHGLNPITSALIKWSVNGVPQAAFQWNGQLDSGTEEVQIGTYNFISGVPTKILAFAVLPNDCNPRNDTIRSGSLASALCGIYKIGGANADFSSFNEAISILTVAGINCPVTFRVANGLYNEQIQIGEIQGSSNQNTITFESISLDSSKAVLEYSGSILDRDFTVNFRGSDYIKIRKLGIRRKNGNVAILLSDGNHHIDIQSSLLGNVLSSGTQVDSFLTLRRNNSGFIILNGKPGSKSREMVVSENTISSRTVEYPNHYGVFVSHSTAPIIQKNTINIDSKSALSGSACEEQIACGIGLLSTSSADVSDNVARAVSSFYYGRCPHEALGLKVENSSDALVKNNQFLAESFSSLANTKGALLEGNNQNFLLENNVFSLASTITQATEVRTVNGILNLSSGKGKIMGNVIRLLSSSEAGNTGIQSAGDSLEIAYNSLSNFKSGIESRSQFARIHHNRVSNIAGDGISLLLGNNQLVSHNRLLGISGTGLLVQSSASLIFNNFIHVTGNLPARGIWLKQSANNSRLYNNSINSTGTDVLSSFALEVERGQGSDLKNNIFNNYGSGQALKISSLSGTRSWNYNCYFSKNSALVQNGSQSLWTLSDIQSVLGQDANSFQVNPYYLSDTNLIINQSLLDNSGIVLAQVTDDIDGQIRTLPDIGAKEFEPCATDLGINQIQGLQTPLPSGFQPVNVVLQNHGTKKAESVSIFWEVNGIAQTPFFWSGSLPGKTNATVQVGNFYFLPGRAYVVKAWTGLSDGLQDCNLRNDTSQTGTLVTYLCGVFKIGGSNPDFLSVSEAVKALNFTGVSCPIVFKIRNGIYKDQVEIGNVQGSSAINTITFESESGDSSKVTLEYQDVDVNRDFTFGITGTSHLFLKDIGISRKNGQKSLQISGNAHHLSVSNCKLGNVFSPASSTDSVLVFDKNRCGSIQLYSPSNTGSKGVQITSNWIEGTQTEGGSGSALLLSGYRDFAVSGNYISGTYNQNNFGSSVSSFALNLQGCTNGDVRDNVLVSRSRSQFVNTENISIGLLISQSENLRISSNNFTTISAQGYAKSIGCSVEDASKDIEIRNNNFSISSDLSSGSSANLNRGISIVQGSRIVVEGNKVSPIAGSGSSRILYGIFSAGAQSVISGNTISGCGIGIESRGLNSSISQNRISGISGTGVSILQGQGQQIFKNRIFGISNGAALTIQAPGTIVSNNLMQTLGSGVSKGIVVQAGANNSRIIFNSVRVEGTDFDLATALEFQDSENTLIKNNIFTNLSNGNVIQVSRLPAQKDWDFNCYYSGGPLIARLGTTAYSNFSDWTEVVSAEVNSKYLQPFFQSDTLLIPNQRQINGAGIPIQGFDTDIEGKVRSSLAPDLGAYEFITDFGLARLSTPTLACLKSSEEKVSVDVEYKGNVPGNNLVLAYTVNGGNVVTDTIYGNFSQTAAFTFTRTADLSNFGVYRFKLWLVDNQDDNPSNDTITAVRFSGESPVVEILDSIGCASGPVKFNLNATISTGEISPVYEWFFGDSDTSVFLPSPAYHQYGRSDTFHVVARAYTLDGCYGQGEKDIILLPTPQAAFEISDHCFGAQLPLQNLSVMENDSAVYAWNFGDQSGSVQKSPAKIYSSLGEYQVQLVVTAFNSQCSDTISQQIKVNPLPALSTNLDTAYFENEGFIQLDGTPPGGTFFGNGVFGNLFNTDFAGIGRTRISYTYGIAETGCRDTLSQWVNIREFNVPPSLVFQSSDKEICGGKPVSLLVQATGTRLKFQWFRNGQELANDTLSILNFDPAQVVNSGVYQLKVWNQLDTIQTGLIQLKVNPEYSRVDSIIICPGTSYTLPDGQVVSLPGIYVSTNLSAAGCDSTITTVLDTSSLIRRNFAATICNGSLYNFYGTSLSQPGTYQHIIQSGPACDSLYILQLSVTIPDTLQQELSSCNPISWFGQQITSTGNYFHSVPGQQGICDSTYSLLFTLLNQPDTSVTVLSSCGPFEWNGSTYTTGGIYYYQSSTPLGCDSVASLVLTVLPKADTSITTVSNCGPYVWNNLLYLVSGSYFQTFSLENGCDSVAQLNVQIFSAGDTSRLEISSCGPYLWNNQLLDSSGTYYFKTSNAGGCDSTALLQLLVFPKPDTLVQSSTHCGPYLWNGTLLSSSGTYYFNTQNSNGCDSVVVLNLQVFPAGDTSLTVIQNCGPYLWNGLTYNASGSYFANFALPGQCDSVARLDLQIFEIESRDTASSCGPYFWNGQLRDSSGTYQVTATNALGCDSVSYLNLTVYAVPDTSLSAAQSCGPYFWNGETYFTTGIYYFQTQNANGCDSTASLNLIVVNPPQDSILVDSSCGPYVWNGTEYTTSGTYTFVTTLPSGCDSTARLVLTIVATSSSELVKSCGPYTWNGELLDTSGIYTRIYSNVLGCDSTATLDLTVYSIPDTSLSQVANCGPYFWNGIFRSVSGTYFYNTLNANGCDSTARLELTLLPQPDTVQVIDSACGSYTWNNQVITESGIYLFITPGPVGGCDTVSRLLITIFPNSSTELITACSEYIWNNQLYTESGTYTFTSQSSQGCDSTATLVLTIISPPESVYLDFSRCLPFQWNNQVFDTAGLYQVNIDLPGICDSIYFITVTQAPFPDTSLVVQTSCGPYFWNGIVRDSSGSYYYSVQNASGCDSVARLDLIILPGTDFLLDPVSTGFTEGNTISLSVQTNPASGSGILLQWQVDAGTGFVNIAAADPAYQGSDSSNLLILNGPLAFDGHRYRCVASNGSCSDTSGIAVITEATLSVQSKTSLLVQPNPARNRTMIKAGQKLQGAAFRLIDLRAVQVVSGNLDGQFTELDLRGLPPGLYTLLVEAPSGGLLPALKVMVE